MTKGYTAIAIAGGLVLVGLVLYVWQKGIAGATKAAVNAASDAVGGAVVGLGDAIGIPETNMSECEQLLAGGHYWDATFKCPAGTLLKGIFGDTPAAIPSTSSPAIASSTGTSAPSLSSPAPAF